MLHTFVKQNEVMLLMSFLKSGAARDSVGSTGQKKKAHGPWSGWPFIRMYSA